MDSPDYPWVVYSAGMDTLDELRRSFLRDLRADGRTPRTGTMYSDSIRFYLAWLSQGGRTLTVPCLDDLTARNVRDWLGYLRDAGRAPNTIALRYRGMRRFCNWLVSEGLLSESPMKGMTQPTREIPPVPVLSDDALRKLLKTCAKPTYTNRRDEAMIRVLLDCGVRVAELCGMTVGATDLDDESAEVIGKGGKRRRIYFSARTTRALDRYLRLRKSHRWAHLDSLWLGERGAFTTDGVREMITRRGREAGLGRLHPHMLRHTFAHEFLAAGGNERDLMRLAGWSTPEMLSVYGASVADARAAEAARRLRPGDRV